MIDQTDMNKASLPMVVAGWWLGGGVGAAVTVADYCYSDLLLCPANTLLSRVNK